LSFLKTRGHTFPAEPEFGNQQTDRRTPHTLYCH